MAPLIFDLSKVHDPSDVVHRAVEALAEGKIIAVPTETVYGVAISGLHEDAIERLYESKGREATNPFALALKSAEDALDYVPNMSPLGRRLARRCWPGPLTIVFPNISPDSVVTQLPETVQRRICGIADHEGGSLSSETLASGTLASGTLGVRVPANQTLLNILRFSRGPIVLTSANLSGQADVIDAKQVVASIGNWVDIVIDDGPCRFGQPSTVVKIQGDRCEILREGVIARKTLKRMANFTALLVCTGNTCRSPMAECLMKKHLAKRLDCKVDQLPEKGVTVVSAGVAAGMGAQASRESIQVMAEQDLDLSLHESQPVNDTLIRTADLILTMTNSHRNAIVSHWPEAAGRTHVITNGREDVSDPIGGPSELYQRCANQIEQHIEKWVAQLDLNLPECLDE